MLFNPNSLENNITDIEESVDLEDEVKDTATTALSVCYGLFQQLQDNGIIPAYEPGDEVDFAMIEDGMDAILGELAAACLTLSEPSLDGERMLRGIGENLSKESSVPNPVTQGFLRLANRVATHRVALEGE